MSKGTQTYKGQPVDVNSPASYNWIDVKSMYVEMLKREGKVIKIMYPDSPEILLEIRTHSLKGGGVIHLFGWCY